MRIQVEVARPYARGQAGESGGTERGRLDQRRTPHRQVHDAGEELHLRGDGLVRLEEFLDGRRTMNIATIGAEVMNFSRFG